MSLDARFESGARELGANLCERAQVLASNDRRVALLEFTFKVAPRGNRARQLVGNPTLAGKHDVKETVRAEQSPDFAQSVR